MIGYYCVVYGMNTTINKVRMKEYKMAHKKKTPPKNFISSESVDRQSLSSLFQSMLPSSLVEPTNAFPYSQNRTGFAFSPPSVPEPATIFPYS